MANPIASGFKKWIKFNVANENPILSEQEKIGGASPPPPSMFFLQTESGEDLLTESGQNIEVENP